jgi:hypothetical protein
MVPTNKGAPEVLPSYAFRTESFQKAVVKGALFLASTLTGEYQTAS